MRQIAGGSIESQVLSAAFGSFPLPPYFLGMASASACFPRGAAFTACLKS